LHHRHAPRRDASAVGLSMTIEGCHSALLSRHPRAFPSSSPRMRGSSPQVSLDSRPRLRGGRLFAGMTFELTCSRIAPQVPCHPERSEGSRSLHHRHAPRRDALAVGLSMTTENCHPALSPRHPRAFPSSSPRMRGSSPQVSLDSRPRLRGGRLFAGMTDSS
jgi:hypothetical protein